MAAPSSPQRPAFALAALIAALAVAALVTNLMTTPDVWQHRLVGRAIWQLHRVPQEHLWTWPLLGTRDVLPSWLFRALLHPFDALGGEWGLQAWRWLTTLAAFGFAWAAARALGARGFTPLVVIVLCALSYRVRAQVRPETLVAVLLALQLWVLERRRARGSGGGVALVLIAWAWANAHISYYLGLVLTGIHLLTTPHVRSPRALRGVFDRLEEAPLAVVLLASAAISFVNPFGWRALWQPVEYFFVWRHEPVYQAIPELASLATTWPSHLRTGLLPLLVLWPVLVLWRPRGRPFDRAEALTALVFTALTLFNQRFAGFHAVVMVPYLSRDLSRWLPPPGAATARNGVLAVAAAAALVLTAGAGQTQFPAGVGFVDTCVPRRACDVIAQTGLRGRMFNPFYFGGYVLWRFWPDRDRLPFMDIHQSGTRADRDRYAYSFADRATWQQLSAEHDFRIALLDGHQEWIPSDHLIDFLDADTTWALIFRDDAAALYVRRSGGTARLADSLGYAIMPGGVEGFIAIADAVARDTTLRALLRADLERSLASSPLNSLAHSHLANLAFLDGDRAAARRHLEAAVRVEPHRPTLHRRLGYLALSEQRPRDAVREFEAELAIGGSIEDDYLRLGQAWEALGDRGRAARWYERERQRRPFDPAAREALERLKR